MATNRSVDKTVKMVNNRRPEPPDDIVHKFQMSTFTTFYAYLEARPYDRWTIPDLRLLSQAALLEDIIYMSFEEVAQDGITSRGSTGNLVSHPALGTLNKAQGAQGAIFRRLGISIDGLVKPERSAGGAYEQAKVNPKTMGKKGSKQSYSEGLLA